MRVEVFCLCDYAAVDASRKLTVLGIFDSIRTATLPATHPMCAIAGKIRFETADAGVKQIKIHFRDPQGDDVISPIETQPEVRSELPTASAQIAVLISGLRLLFGGPHSIDLEVEGTRVASTPLYVRHEPLPQTQP